MQNVFQQIEGDDASRPPLTGEERRVLLALAREAIGVRLGTAAAAVAPPTPLSDNLSRPAACFVTLRHGGQLRGCIGQLAAREPLWQAVINNAERAATRDHRFDPLAPTEMGGVRIEVSVLGPAVPLEFETPEDLLAQLRPGHDGVILRIGESVSTFLPQVWEDLPDKVQFLEHLCRKGGHDPGAWCRAGTAVLVYPVEHFEEP